MLSSFGAVFIVVGVSYDCKFIYNLSPCFVWRATQLNILPYLAFNRDIEAFIKNDFRISLFRIVLVLVAVGYDGKIAHNIGHSVMKLSIMTPCIAKKCYTQYKNNVIVPLCWQSVCVWLYWVSLSWDILHKVSPICKDNVEMFA